MAGLIDCNQDFRFRILAALHSTPQGLGNLPALPAVGWTAGRWPSSRAFSKRALLPVFNARPACTRARSPFQLGNASFNVFRSQLLWAYGPTRYVLRGASWTPARSGPPSSPAPSAARLSRSSQPTESGE